MERSIWLEGQLLQLLGDEELLLLLQLDGAAEGGDLGGWG